MMYVDYKNGSSQGWHTGEPKPSGYSVVRVQADGDELAHVRATIKGIPDAAQSVVAWGEPWARFIVENL